MKTILKILSFLGLALVILPPVAYLLGATEKPTMSALMILGSLMWFVAAPLGAARSSGENPE